MAVKYYAVKVGKVPGIYRTWDDCKNVVNGFPGAIYKSFTNIEDAERFAFGDSVGKDNKKENKKENKKDNNEIISDLTCATYSFVDGSFNVNTGVYGYGGFLVHNGQKYIIKGSGNDPEMASMRNVAGEILGCMEAVKLAISMGIKEIDIFYDYMGIEMWADGAWKRNKAGTMFYYDFMQEAKTKIKINFKKVKGHSGIDGNEEADQIAKSAVGII